MTIQDDLHATLVAVRDMLSNAERLARQSARTKPHMAAVADDLLRQLYEVEAAAVDRWLDVYEMMQLEEVYA